MSNTLEILTAWQTAMRDCDKVINTLMSGLGLMPESPVLNAIGALQELATKQAAALAGISDDWLGAWWVDNDFGKKPFEVRINGEWRSATTLEELIALIEADAKGAKE